jgi:predicted alpha/beta hydrolase family esterase
VNWEKVRKNCEKFVCFAGNDDPYTPQDILKDFANKVGAEEFIIIPNGGHLNAEFGYTSFPQLLEKIKRVL